MSFEQYYTYEELNAWLYEKKNEYPNLLQIETIGQSYEGREVLSVVLTDRRAGDPSDKPALYVDGNIHAGEVTASMICLYLIDYLIKNYQTDSRARKILRDRTLYIIPRVNPDGAEKYLTSPQLLRSSVRTYPKFREEYNPQGLHPEDVDGDGRILKMRIRDDDTGPYKVDPEDDRLMIARTPNDIDGPFYHIYQEGMIRDVDGNLVEDVQLPFDSISNKYGLDLNRNFPAGYKPTARGAGPYPLSEPETRNLLDYIDDHPNIGGSLLYHTTGGVLFRPHSFIKDEDFDEEDMKTYRTVGSWGEEATGYPVICCYGDIWSGVLDDWFWEHRGIYSFTPELWDLMSRANPDIKNDPTTRRNLTLKKQHKMQKNLLKYIDQNLGGDGFWRWRQFSHPQLGQVEIGGWEIKECWQNPPTYLLTAECHKNIQFPITFALALPEVSVDHVEINKLSADDVILSVVVKNCGFFDTNISKQAVDQNAVHEDIIKLHLPANTELLSGEKIAKLGFLNGYHALQRQTKREQIRSARAIQWTIDVSNVCENAQFYIEANSQRGGTVRTAAKY